MKTTSYGKTKQHLFVGLLLGVIVLSTQAQALSIEQPGPPICCQAYNAKCLSCAEGISEERFCKKKRNRDVPGCEKYHRRGSWGENDRDDSRQQGDGSFRNWFG